MVMSWYASNIVRFKEKYAKQLPGDINCPCASIPGRVITYPTLLAWLHQAIAWTNVDSS